MLFSYLSGTMTLYIKNMVCQRCIQAVRQALDDMEISYQHIQLGEVELREPLNEERQAVVAQRLNNLGFELIEDRKSRLIGQIKTAIVELVHYTADQPRVNLSTWIAERLHYDYHYLSNLFSEIEGITIEKYHIAQKIERVKELLVYDELSLSEIADRMGYSSVAHLSNQFKKVTGLTPSHFKNIRSERRKPLDSV